jgi:hypothetical protein
METFQGQRYGVCDDRAEGAGRKRERQPAGETRQDQDGQEQVPLLPQCNSAPTEDSPSATKGH